MPLPWECEHRSVILMKDYGAWLCSDCGETMTDSELSDLLVEYSKEEARRWSSC